MRHARSASSLGQLHRVWPFGGRSFQQQPARIAEVAGRAGDRPSGPRTATDEVRAGVFRLRCAGVRLQPMGAGFGAGPAAADSCARGRVGVSLVRNIVIVIVRLSQAGSVCQYSRHGVVNFWSRGAFVDEAMDREFNMSVPCQSCDFFVSHSRNRPSDWYNHFQRKSSFEA